VLARNFAPLLAIATSFVTVPARAGADRPVFVVVVGQGAIRVRLAAGVVAPCDSHDNRMIFDGWLEVGRHSWTTDADFVCFQHTSGALRESDWSVSRLVSTVTPRPARPMEIRVSTD
jgi:hypothetical protein